MTNRLDECSAGSHGSADDFERFVGDLPRPLSQEVAGFISMSREALAGNVTDEFVDAVLDYDSSFE